MAVLLLSPYSDRFSEISALMDVLADWLASQPPQRARPLRVELIQNDDGSLAGITTEPVKLELVTVTLDEES